MAGRQAAPGDEARTLRALLDAVVAIGSDLELGRTLERIVAAACRLAGARYGALGVVGDDRDLVNFVTYGLTPEQYAAIGDPPSGRGVLGLLIEQPQPLRLADISQHPSAHGFPPNHPAMTSFLGVPVRVRGQIYGNLYLADKQGAAEFSAADEQVVVALAAAAGAAIDNARMYEVARRRHRWLAAAGEITNVLLGRVHRTEALALVARSAREVAEAALAMVLLHDEDSGLLVVEVVDSEPGSPAGALAGAALPVAETEFADAVSARHDVQVEHLGKSAPWPVPLGGGEATVVPLVASGGLHGLLLVGYRPGQRRDVDADLVMITTFAGQAALAMERSQAQEEREMLAVLEDRERIARDLHDVVIQRLFATGLRLQTVSTLAGRPELAGRINSAVDELDTTIRDIRAAIFELRTPMSSALRSELREIVDAAAGPLGFRPTLEIFGPVDSAASDQVRADILAVVREALSNVVRHAGAHAVTVRVRAESGQLSVTVVDDGVGTVSAVARGGLVNLRQRAERHDGSFALRSNGTGEPSRPGTVLEWSVPVR